MAVKKVEQPVESFETPETAEPSAVQKNPKDEDIKIESINRLKKVLGTLQYSQGDGDVDGGPVAAAVSSEPAATQKVALTDRAPEKAASAEIPVAARPPEPEVALSPEIQKFAEDFTRNFITAAAGSFQEMHRLLAEDRGRAGAAVEEYGGQIAALLEQVESCSGLLADMQSVIQDIHSRQEMLEKRLELQAGAIRTVHAAAQDREDRFNRLLLTLQPATAQPETSGLPDNL